MSNYKLRDCPHCGSAVHITDKQIMCECGIGTRKFRSVSALVSSWNSYGASHWRYDKNEDMFICAACGCISKEPFDFCQGCGKRMNDKLSKVPIQGKDGLYECLICHAKWDMKTEGKTCPMCRK